MPLIFAMDAYVVKVLEHVGNRIVRKDRARPVQRCVPVFRAHTQWPMGSDEEIAPLLRDSWRALGEMALPWECYGLSAEEVAGILDRYVADLLLTGSQHSIEDLAYRLHREPADPS